MYFMGGANIRTKFGKSGGNKKGARTGIFTLLIPVGITAKTSLPSNKH
jgi:hypothetical protein